MTEVTMQMAYDYIKNGDVPELKTESPQILITEENIDSQQVKDFGVWADLLRTRSGN